MEWYFTKPESGIVSKSFARNWTLPCSDEWEGKQRVKIIGYGDRIAPGDYFIHSRFRRVSNFLKENDMVSVVEPSIGFGPFNIVIEGCNPWKINRVIIGKTSIMLGSISFEYNTDLSGVFQSIYDSSIPIPIQIDIHQFQNTVQYFKEIIQEHAPSKSLVFLLDKTKEPLLVNTFERNLMERFIAGRRAIDRGNIMEGVNKVKGLGLGLTPSGDDFIAGLLVALNIRRIIFQHDFTVLIEDIYTRAQNGNPFSTAFLRSAKEGRIFEKLKYTITALFDPVDLLKRTLDLLDVGSTSGADMAVGLIIGLEKIKPYAS